MEDATLQHEVIIVGAGVAGIYQLYRLLEMGVDVTVLEAGSGPGGTWYWNRYPGCRFDSESYTYGYSFSKELMNEWNWSEHFSGQPETLRYLEHVVEKFDLRKHMQFGRRVKSAVFDEDACLWILNLSDGRNLTTRFLFTAIGMLSAPTMPDKRRAGARRKVRQSRALSRTSVAGKRVKKEKVINDKMTDETEN